MIPSVLFSQYLLRIVLLFALLNTVIFMLIDRKTRLTFNEHQDFQDKPVAFKAALQFPLIVGAQVSDSDERVIINEAIARVAGKYNAAFFASTGKNIFEVSKEDLPAEAIPPSRWRQMIESIVRTTLVSPLSPPVLRKMVQPPLTVGFAKPGDERTDASVAFNLVAVHSIWGESVSTEAGGGIVFGTTFGCFYTATKQKLRCKPGQEPIFSFERVLIHELGHSLGLGHAEEADSIMQAVVPYLDSNLEIGVADKQRINFIVGKNKELSFTN